MNRPQLSWSLYLACVYVGGVWEASNKQNDNKENSDMGTVKCNDVIQCSMAAHKNAQGRLAMERCFCRDPCDKKGEP